MVPKLRFKEFCGEWEEKRLGDVIQYFYNGQTPSRNNLNFWNGNIPWVSSGELNYNTIKCTNEYITEDGKRNAHLKLLPKGTFLIAITGLEAPGTRGSCAFLGIDATTNQSCMALVPYKKKLNSKFLFQWYMKIGEYYGIKYTQGTKQQSYNIDLLKRLPIILPDNLFEQTKIAEFLSTVDDKIQNQQDKITHLENIKKGFMQKIFSRKIRFKDDGGEEFPEWEEKRIKDILKEVVEKTTILDQYEVISSTSNGIYTQKEYFNRDIASKNNIGYKVLKINQIVLSPQNLWMGNINLNKKFKIGMVSPSYKIFNIVERNNINFIGYFLRTPKAFYEYKISSEQGASIVRRNLNMDLFNNIKIMLPCLKEQEKIADFLLSFDKKIDAEKENLEHLKVVKKGLLQQMFV